MVKVNRNLGQRAREGLSVPGSDLDISFCGNFPCLLSSMHANVHALNKHVGCAGGFATGPKGKQSRRIYNTGLSGPEKQKIPVGARISLRITSPLGSKLPTSKLIRRR